MLRKRCLHQKSTGWEPQRVTSPNFFGSFKEPGPGKLITTKDPWFGVGSIVMQLQLNEFN